MEDDDDMSLPETQDPNSLPQVATPDDEAEAAAEVAAMGQTAARGRDPTADAAIMGAAGDEEGVGSFSILDENGELVRQAFLQFLMEYRQEVQTDEEDGNQEATYIYPYTEQADQIARLQMSRRSSNNEDATGLSGFSSTLLLNFEHVMRHDPELADAIKGEFVRFEPYLRMAVQSFIFDLHPQLSESNSTALPPTFFVAAHNLPTDCSIRRLKTDLVGALAAVSGTVTRSSDVKPELLVGSFRCNKCGLLASSIRQQFHYTRPTICRNPRCKNKSPMAFTLEIRQSEFVDWQKLRVQENSSQIPPGSMPRSMDVIIRNEMVERAKAGDKCIFTGSLVVIPDGSALARAGEAAQSSKSRSRPNDAASGGGGGVRGLSVLGVRELTYRTCFLACSVLPAESAQQANNNEQVTAAFLFGKATMQNHEPTTDEVAMEFTETQRAEIRAMRASPRLYDQMVESIAPTTFGHKEVKRGILLMLLGGVHKQTADGIKLRGDINVCVVGDPSTAKSQFLKYVHSFLPNRTVYTSGKASSAAGLTAAVQRDQDTGEYCIEAGALMLADNGICCIDEFDKMDINDQVAIHEAMEQQTISITKAGIQATLNARASILAAANPIYGRYDRTKTLKSNVALSAPILSRFDLFFVVLDECNPDSDRQVAKHILSVHRCEDRAVTVPFTKDQMRRYIRFARTLNPRLTPESQRMMVDCYRKLRQGDTLGRSRAAYRITVRQLESMVRLSEALARLYCADEIQPAYVREAFRLLKTSIIQVETSDVEVEDEDFGDNAAVNANYDGKDDDDNHDDGDDHDKSMEDQTQNETQAFETQAVAHPGEYSNADDAPADAATDVPTDVNQEADKEHNADEDPVAVPPIAEKKSKKKKKSKRKTKISFEEYETIANAIAGHLRAIESTMDGEEEKPSPYLSWKDVLDWYLAQCEDDIGDSMERLEDTKKRINLVIRRLINVDRILVTVGDIPSSKKEELKTLLAVHPNYEVI